MRWSPCASTAMSTCPPTRPPRSARPACWARSTSNWRPRPTPRRKGKLHEGSLIPLAHSAILPDHRADPGGAVSWCSTAVDWARSRTSPRLSAPRSAGRETRPAQPDRATRQIHRQPQRPDRRHHRRHRKPQHAGRHSSPTSQPVWTGARDHPRCAGGAQQRTGQPRRGGRPARQILRLVIDHRRRVSKANLVKELKDIGPVLESLANAGPSLTRALSLHPDVPLPQRDHREMAARRLRQPDRDRRPHAQPNRPGPLHRHPLGGRI